jgi:hypothetical protein
MKSIAIMIMATVSSVPSQRMEIAIRVAGEGRPNCQSYRADGTVGSCLPTFAIRRGGGINGRSLAGKITFTPAAMVRLTEDEFALLAGHEVAHYYLGHKSKAMANELAADRLGAELACKAGYDPIAGATLFRHLRPSRVHPSSETRLAGVLKVECEVSTKSYDFHNFRLGILK